jgi:hypothetical protein
MGRRRVAERAFPEGKACHGIGMGLDYLHAGAHASPLLPLLRLAVPEEQSCTRCLLAGTALHGESTQATYSTSTCWHSRLSTLHTRKVPSPDALTMESETTCHVHVTSRDMSLSSAVVLQGRKCRHRDVFCTKTKCTDYERASNGQNLQGLYPVGVALQSFDQLPAPSDLRRRGHTTH